LDEEDSALYTVVITLANGCTVSGSQSLKVNSAPAIELGGMDLPCGDGMMDLPLTATVTNDVDVTKWEWTGPEGFSSPDQNPMIANATSVNAGTYTVVATSANGCSTEATFDVSVNAQRGSSISSFSTGDCLGSVINLRGTEDPLITSYEWSASPSEGAGLPNDSDTSTINATPTQPGTYTYFYSFTLGGCESEVDSVTITIAEQPVADLSFTSSAELTCVTDDVSLSINNASDSGTAYSWEGPNGFTSDQKSPTLNGVTSLNAGTYNVTITNTGGCTSTASIDVPITDGITITPDITAEGSLCTGEDVILSTKVFDGATYTWTGPGGTILDETGSELTLEDLGGLFEGNYTVYFTIDGCESNVSQGFVISLLDAPDANQDLFNVEFNQAITVNPIANDRLDPNASVSVSVLTNVTNGTLTNNGNGTFTYTPTNGFSGSDEFSYQVCYDGCENLCDVNVVTFNVIFNDPECATVHNLITPNGDGVNDNFFIPCLEANLFPSSFVCIFNEWGDQVFTAQPYNNDFDGTIDGKDLPDGTYYYIFQKSPDNNDVKRGFITLQR